MSEGAQFDFFRAPRPPRPKAFPKGDDSLFFALYPDSATAAAIARQGADLRKAHGLTGRPRPPEALHVTLRHVGDFVGRPPELVAALTAALEDFSAPAFDVTLTGAMRFNGAGAVVLVAGPAANPELMSFQQTLCDRLDDAGASWRVGGAGFTPHVTVAYDRAAMPPQDIAPIRWRAREFVLVQSLHRQTRHVALARVLLG